MPGEKTSGSELISRCELPISVCGSSWNSDSQADVGTPSAILRLPFWDRRERLIDGASGWLGVIPATVHHAGRAGAILGPSSSGLFLGALSRACGVRRPLARKSQMVIPSEGRQLIRYEGRYLIDGA